MAVLPILHYPDARLREVANPVSKVNQEIKTLISDMIETMYDANGIGLAATQIDRHVQVIVMDLSEERNQPRVFINPKITILTDELQTYKEGCLSIPQYYEEVTRPSKVKIEALDGEGKVFIEDAEGLLAICIQHEIDHLNGKLFVDYLSNLKQQRAKDKVKKHLKNAKKLANNPN